MLPSKEDVLETLKLLIETKKEIAYHDRLYYLENTNTISDFDYDMLLSSYMKLLIKMRKLNYITDRIYKDLEHSVGLCFEKGGI